MEFSRGNRNIFCHIKFKWDFLLEVGGSIVDYFSGIWKPLCKDGGLDVGYMVNADTIWRLNNTQVNIG